MKILIFSIHYPPDIGAVSFRMEALVKALLHRSHTVYVMTSKPNRYEAVEKIPFRKFEKYPNLEIKRIDGGKRNDVFWRRPFNYIIFMINSFLSSLKLKSSLSDEEIVLATSPPITVAITALILCYLKRHKKLVLEIRDLWPDTLIELKIFKNKLIIALLKVIEKVLYQRSNLIIAVTEEIKNKIIQKGINKEKIQVFTNGLDREMISGLVLTEIKLSLREKYHLPKESLIISYIGNVGISQGLEIIVDAAVRMKDDNILFLIVGDGLDKNKMIKLARERMVEKKIVFLSSLPRNSLSEIYAFTDILFLQLRNIPLFDGAIPSKIFEYLGSGLPVIYGLTGIAADIFQESTNGIKIKQENADDLVEAIKKIQSHYPDYLEKAKKGREFVINNYLREDIMEHYVLALEKLFQHF